jgi:hypothetical protein
MDLTTATRVGNLVYAGGSVTSSFNTTVGNLITAASALAETYLDRRVKAEAQVEYFDVSDGQKVFALKGYPVSALTSVYFDFDQSFGASTALDSDDYFNPVLNARGLLVMKFPFAIAGNETWVSCLKVSYTGGMAANTSAFVSAFPDIATAIDQQVAYWYHQRNHLGNASVSGDMGSVSPGADSLLPSVKLVLDLYRRRT